MHRTNIRLFKIGFLAITLVLLPLPIASNAASRGNLPAIGNHLQDHAGVIRGQVFIDQDDDGLYDPGEAPLEGVGIEVSNGLETQIVFTSEFGTFELAVPAGTWRAIIHPPEGFIVTNDETREVVIGEQSTYEAVMDFALIPAQAPGGGETPTAEPELEGTELEEASGTDFQDQLAEPSSEVCIEEQDENVDHSSTLGGSILPESGGSSRVVFFFSLWLVGILAVAAIFTIVGRRLSR